MHVFNAVCFHHLSPKSWNLKLSTQKYKLPFSNIHSFQLIWREQILFLLRYNVSNSEFSEFFTQSTRGGKIVDSSINGQNIISGLQKASKKESEGMTRMKSEKKGDKVIWCQDKIINFRFKIKSCLRAIVLWFFSILQVYNGRLRHTKRK